MTDLADVQRAVRNVPGVVHAVMRWPHPQGPATLRVEFSAGADVEALSRAVMRAIADAGEVEVQGAIVSDREAQARAAFTRLSLVRNPDHVEVEVTLTTAEGDHVGRHGGPPGQWDTVDMVARATLSALAGLAPHLELEVSRVEHHPGEAEPDRVTVQVRDERDQLLLGSALVRDDRLEAVARATLDAVNRQVLRLPA